MFTLIQRRNDQRDANFKQLKGAVAICTRHFDEPSFIVINNHRTRRDDDDWVNVLPPSAYGLPAPAPLK